MRDSGLDILGRVPWGTHFCQFYQTQQDLTDLLVPYLRQGLLDNELCMWVTSEPLGAAEAEAALRRAMPDLDDYLRRGQLEILDYHQWYTLGGRFDAERVLRGWVDKEKAARQHGWAGLRLTGNTFWLEPGQWTAFTDYEAMVNAVLPKHRIIALCTYCLERCGTFELLDVVRNHQFALIKKAQRWEIIQSAEHKKTQAALRQSEERYRALVEFSPLAIAVRQEDRYVYVNPACVRLFGAGCSQDLIGQGASELVQPGACALVAQPREPGQTPPEPTVKCEGRIRRVDGQAVDVVTTSTPIVYEGKPALQVILEDITQRKQVEQERERIIHVLRRTEQALERQVETRTADLTVAIAQLQQEVTQRLHAQQSLRENELRFETLGRIAPVGIFRADLSGARTYVNQRWCQITGVPMDLALGQGWTEALHPEDRDRVVREWAATVATQKPFAMEYRYPQSDGSDVWVMTQAMAEQDAAGQTIGYIGTVTDVTSLKAAQRKDEFTGALLEFFAHKGTRKEYLESVARALHDWTGCRCVGVRVLDEERQIPYEAYLGFDREFWEKENCLSLEHDRCICIRVFQGAKEPIEAAQLTLAGSFRCDDTGRFAQTLGARAKTHYRGTCIARGFASLAVVPVRYCGQTLGTIQLADERPNRVPPGTVELIEAMSPLIGEAIHRFNIEETLRQQNQALRDSQKRVRAINADLKERTRQLRHLAAELTHAEERERRRLAQVLHDHLQQILVGARFSLELLRQQARDPDLRKLVGRVDELLDEAIKASRSLTMELSPPVLYTAGLAEALQWLGRWMQDKHGLAVEVQVQQEADPASEDLRVLLFQAVRELLFNIVKHAGVRQAQVRLSQVGAQVRVVVSDQGVGFDPATLKIARGTSGGFGLLSIHERLDLLGGRLEADSAPGQGTRFTLQAPCGPVRRVPQTAETAEG